MSIDVYVFIRDDQLPSHEAWQQVLDELGSGLRLDEFSPRAHTGFLPASLSGEECGFEYFFEPVNTTESDWIPSEIADRNRIVTFVWHSNELDAQAGLLAAAALAKMTNGVYYDPQSGDVAQGDSVFELLREQDAAERDRRMRRAEEKWGSITQRRCPKCGAPCPEYKKKCGVCDYELGRA